MIFALEYIDDEDVINVIHLHKDGTLETFVSSSTTDVGEWTLNSNILQISVLKEEQTAPDNIVVFYSRLGEVDGRRGRSIKEFLAEINRNPQSMYEALYQKFNGKHS